ncbi:MAG: exosortase/archaeosortase family protein [Phycisphaerales bacterium]
MSAISRRRWTWPQLALLGVLCVAAIWACWPAWMDIREQAVGRIDAGYILLVPFVAGYLFWLRRSRLRFVPCRPSLVGPMLACAAIALTWYGEEIDNHLARHLGALMALSAAILSLTGLEAVRQFGAVFLSLLFLCPVPGVIRQELTRPLQAIAAGVTADVLELFNVSVIRQGAVLVVRGNPIAVGEACDGMRMVFALALVVFAFVFSVPFRTGTRVLLIALSPVIALLVNVIRLLPTSVAYGVTTPERASFVHDVAGWAMIPAAIVLLLALVRLLRWLDLPVFRWRFLSA